MCIINKMVGLVKIIDHLFHFSSKTSTAVFPDGST
jgi:hypothetical protein